MKQLLFFLVLSYCFPTCINAQCVIYSCDNTGAFGAGYNNDNTPTSYQECEDVAIKGCRDNGGTNCTLLYKSTKAGWWGIINGQKSDGRNYFQGGDGYSSQSEAESEIRRKYREDGGYNADNIKVYTWYSYSNLK